MSEKTLLGAPPSINATQTIKPVQCPVCKTFNPVGVMFCVECGLIFDRSLPEDAFGAPTIQLPILLEAGGREHPLRPGDTVVGRFGDIAIDDPRVSRRHAVLSNAEESVTIEDLGSTNGTTVNGEAMEPGSPRVLAAGDLISFGGFEASFGLPGEAAKTAMGVGGRTAAIKAPPSKAKAAFVLVVEGLEHPLTPGKHSFGRRAENDVCVPNPFVSGTHGRIEVQDDGVYFTDLGSTNGTLLGDVRLGTDQRTRIEPGDILRIGELELELRRAEAE